MKKKGEKPVKADEPFCPACSILSLYRNLEGIEKWFNENQKDDFPAAIVPSLGFETARNSLMILWELVMDYYVPSRKTKKKGGEECGTHRPV